MKEKIKNKIANDLIELFLNDDTFHESDFDFLVGYALEQRMVNLNPIEHKNIHDEIFIAIKDNHRMSNFDIEAWL